MPIIATIPLTTAFLELIKRIGIPEKYRRFIPFLAMIIGIGVVWLLGKPDLALKAMILEGVITGLSSSGLYSAGKSVLKKKKV